jgi:hypothetical protein
VNFEIILHDFLVDVSRGLLRSLTCGYPKNSEREPGADVRFQTSFKTLNTQFTCQENTQDNSQNHTPVRWQTMVGPED